MGKRGGEAPSDQPVSINHELFDGTDMGRPDLLDKGNETLGVHYVFDENYGPHRLSATAGETAEEPLKIYYRAAVHQVIYRYDDSQTIPEGAAAVLPQPQDAPYYSPVSIAADPVLPGYRFTGWELESPPEVESFLENGVLTMPNEDVTFVGSWEKMDTVTVTPADITIYVGGDGGYDAVVGNTGTTTSSSLPHPIFYITLPDNSTGDPTGLTFVNGDKSWTVTCDNPDSAGRKLYHFIPGQGQEEVRVTYTDSEQNKVVSDEFSISDIQSLYTTFQIDIYAGNTNLSSVEAVAGAQRYGVTFGSGTLTVRAIANQHPTTDVSDKAPADRLSSGSALAVEPSGGTVFTLNDTGVELPSEAKSSLLFDGILLHESAMRTRADTVIGEVGDGEVRSYEVRYLDLVDANNGNAWITSSNGVDVYWGYPEGTDSSTSFQLVHLRGLHREGSQTGSYVENDIYTCVAETVPVENTQQGIRFHIPAAGFSPFVLAWDTPSVPQRFGSLTVSKTVDGTGGDPESAFSFTIMLGDTSISGTYGDMTFEDGVARFTLRHGESRTASGLPADVNYLVREDASEGYTTSAEGASGIIVQNATAQARFVNHPVTQPPKTDDNSHRGLWLALMLLSLCGMLAVRRNIRNPGKR